MNWIAVLQELYQQFPRPNDPLFHVSRVEKILQKKLGVARALFTFRQKNQLKTEEGKSVFTALEAKAVFQHLNRTPKPWIGMGKKSVKWLGFWPVVVGKDWIACYALGRKVNGSVLSGEEKGIMELLAERTAYDLENRRLWKFLEKADKQASLGFMSAVMVHEIRNPLTALGTLVQLLPHKKNDEKFMESFQKLMLQEVDHLTQLTETFLNFSKLGLDKSQGVDLQGVVKRVTQMLEPLFASKKVRLKVEGTEGLLIQGDEHQIESLVMNLSQNAFQSVVSKGTVAISTGFLPRSKGSGPWVELRVRDDGAGISKGNIGKIFDPSFSTKSGGAGLGLAICRKIVENHQGFITMESSHKKGTIFKVLLPAAVKP